MLKETSISSYVEIKLIIVLICSFFLHSIAFTQDTLIKKNGEEIECVVLEVAIDQIKYKKFNNQEGPTYSVLKEEIYMIKYKNGDKDIFNYQIPPKKRDFSEPLIVKNGIWGLTILRGDTKLKPKDIRAYYSSHKKPLKQYNTGKSLQISGTIIGLSSIVGFGWILTKGSIDHNMNKQGLLYTGIGCLSGIILGTVGDMMIKKSVNNYNLEINSISSIHLKLGLSYDGFGLCLQF